jgi:phosphatidylglycerophosphatase C
VKKRIAFFDFDGTITTKDTFLEFIKFCKGNLAFYFGMLLNGHYLLGLKLKLVPNQKAKEKVLEHFFKGMSSEEFKMLCHQFSLQALPKLIRPKAVEEIKKLQAENYTVVIVSASPQNWILPWADTMNLPVLASCLETKEGKVTGKLDGKNCRGAEKVRRITENYTVGDYETIYAYGDSSGDLEMLKLATKAYYKPFR